MVLFRLCGCGCEWVAGRGVEEAEKGRVRKGRGGKGRGADQK